MSESGIASGIRRVEAVAGAAAVDYMNTMDAVVRSLTKSLNVSEAGCVYTSVVTALRLWAK